MATALLTINADGRNALATINQIQQALDRLQNSANLNINGQGGIGNNGNNVNNQLNQMNRGIQQLTSLTNAWATAIERTVVNALKSAYSEIKNIDDELVTIRRVTGRTGSELDALTAKATNVAKTYGTAASDYLKSVSSFSKAGYGEAADSLGELSVKAQRVGDISQKVADQFLLAVDKGYQFNGSIEQLSAVLDGANEIGNRFATDIDQIAAGLGKVAPIAAQAHVSVYELEAALGTITSVTQRSGTEAATALRALFLNIMGDTKTEIEDGAKWTAGEIEGLQDLLKIYASDVVEAAQKTGQVINPMEAIASLSKAFREGVLTEQALVSMVSDIGGKLRTTQLLALIQNWDMYTAMVETATHATGSADAEIENSLDSITVKMNILKATWVDMVSDTVSSRVIKNFIDLGTNALNAFGNLGTLLTNIAGIVVLLKGYRISETIRGIFSGITAGGLTGALSIIGAVVTAYTALITVINNGNLAAKRQIDSLANTAKEAAGTSDSIYDLYLKVKEAAPGTDEYTAALARLAAQMGLTSEEAKNLTGSVDEYTKAALTKAAQTAHTAYQELESKLQDKNIFSSAFLNFENFSKRAAGSFEIVVEDAAKEVQDIVSRNLGGLADGFKNGHYTLFDELMPTMSIEELIETFESLEKTYNELTELSFNNPAFKELAQSNVYKDVQTMMAALKDLYTQAKTTAEGMADSFANLALFDLEEKGTIDQWRTFNEEIASGASKSEESLKAVLQAMVNFVESVNDGTLNGRYLRNSLITKLAEQFPQLAAYIEDWKDVIGEVPKNGVAETSKDASKELKNLTDALSEATKAKNEFDKAMEAAAENEAFQSYKDAYETYANEIKEGRVNSRKAKAAAKYLLGNEAYDSAYSGGGYKGVNAAMQGSNLDLLYGEEGGEYGEGFFKFLTKYANAAGEVVDANGDVIASLALVGDAVNFDVASIADLSEVTGLSVGQIGAASDALSVYGNVVFKEIEALNSYIKNLQGVSEGENGIFTIDYETFKKQFDYGDLTSDGWESLKQTINLANELGKVVLKNVTEGWLEADDAMERAMEDAPGELEGQKQAAEAAKEEAQALSEEAEKAAQGAREAVAAVQAEMEAIKSASAESQEQVAAINSTLALIREALGEEAANNFLTSLQSAAVNAGADIVATEGVVTELKGVGGQPMTWELFASLVNATGLANAAVSDLGVKITGLDKDLPEIEIKTNATEAGKELIVLGLDATRITFAKREFKFGIEGDVTAKFSDIKDDAGKTVEQIHYFKFSGEDNLLLEKQETIISDAENVATETIFFSYGADDELDELSIQKVQEHAGEVTEIDTLKFKYGIDGKLEKGESETQLLNAAGQVTQQRHFKFTYGIDGELDDAESGTLYTNAEGITTGVEYKFKYGADGRPLVSSRTTIRNLANGVIDKEERKFTYGADGDPLKYEIEHTILPNANDATTKDVDKRVFHYTAEGKLIPIQAAFIRFQANKVTGKTMTFHYDAEWNLTGKTYKEIAEDADGVLVERTVKFDANGEPVETTVEELGNKVNSLVNPPNPYEIVIQADGGKVLQTLGDLEEAIINAQNKIKTYNFGTGGSAETADINALSADLEELTDLPEGFVGPPQLGQKVTNDGRPSGAVAAWLYDMTHAKPASWVDHAEVEVEVNATGEVKDVENVVDNNGKTVKIGADITAKGDAEDIAKALGGDEDDKTTITKELELELSDESSDLIDGFYKLGTEGDVTMSLRVATDETGNRVFTLLEQSADGTQQIQTVFSVTGDGEIQLQEIKQLSDGLEEKKEMVISADTAAATTGISRLLNRLNQLKSKTITVNANITGKGASSVGVSGGGAANALSKLLGISSNAKGTSSFGGGPSLINEEGPELVTANGWARILGDGEPTIADIPKGATIYTASQTAQILAGARGQTEFPAFATGLLDAWNGIVDAWNNSVVGKAVNNVASTLWNNVKTNVGVGGTVTLPEKKKEEEKKTTTNTSSGGGSGSTEAEDFWAVIQEYIEYGLKKLQYQIDERQEAITALERERDKLLDPIDDEMDMLNWEIEETEYRIKLIERSREAATKALNEQIDALKEQREIEEEDEALEEKRLAVMEAENALMDARNDRTVRYFNEETGQWEWMADQSAVKSAEDSLKDAQEAYDDALKDYQITLLERQVAAIEKTYNSQIEPLQDKADTYSQAVEDLQYQRDKIERDYAQSIDPLQDSLDEVQQTYDDLEKYYNKIQDAIAVPTSDLDAALTAMQSADENYSSQYGNTQSLLDTLYELAPTWSAIDPGTLGVSAAAQAITNSMSTATNFNDVLNKGVNNVININGLTISGDMSMTLEELVQKSGIYRNYNL